MFFLQLLVFGVAVGVVSGLLGIGGGMLLVPGLMILFGFSQPQAQGTSLAAMIPPIGIFAALVYYENGYVRIPVAVAVATGFMVGAYFGARCIPYVPIGWLRLAFGGLMVYLGMSFVLESGAYERIFGTALPRAAAALPAGLAALVLSLGAWFRRSQTKRGPSKLPPPGDEIQYHI